MKRNIYFPLAFLAVSLAFAYFASLPKSESDSTETTWARIDDNQIHKFVYTGDKLKVEAFRSEEAGGDFWVNYLKEPANEKATEVRDTFKANEKIASLKEFFQPLKVKRVLGDLNDEGKKEFGFDAETETTLKIEDAQGKAVLDFLMGKRSFGSRNYFAFDRLRNKVVLLSGSRIEDLSKAQARMYEKSPFDLDFEDIDAAELLVGSQSKKFSRVKKDKNGALGWSDEGADAQVKDSYNGWMRKISKLRVIRYANDAQKAQVKNSQPIFQLKYFRKGQVLEEVSVFKTKSSEGKPEYWLVTNHTTLPAKINTTRAETIEKDVPTILGAS